MLSTLGIDTSNYTTSAAFFDGGQMHMSKKMLPVEHGRLGLRQSDAVFYHVRQLPEVLESLRFSGKSLTAAGVSDKPRSMEGSYMPCFLAGCCAAKAVSLSLGIPLYTFSHQQGHIAAALYSAGKLGLLSGRFIAFHVSGGTTEALLVSPDAGNIISTQIAAQSLDLKGGQAVDRVGRMLGLGFPAGAELEKLALKSRAEFKIKPCMKGADCSLSGVENRCAAMLSKGFPKEDIASYCIQSVLAALDGMSEALIKKFGSLPLVFAGGVTSNAAIRKALTEKYGAFFAAPEYSSDNAAGIAVLAAVKKGGV
ncbi:MAG TPA: peptidase M22 [Ruminococcaceae bacterium]|jgi:N6-L-threonylcarbamoyladenine synthase|nr:peptidase M22 [Oscillospiraceae bacterium]